MKKTYLTQKLKACLLICGLLLMGFTGAYAQSSAQAEAAEQEATNLKDQIYQGLKQQAGISDADLNEFIKYYIDTLARNMGRLTHYLKKHGNISTTIEQQYITAMQAHYLKMYSNYKQIKIEFPSSVAEVLAPQKWHNPTGTCNPACDNIDFSKGDLSAWTCGYASCSSEDASACSNGPPPTGAFSHSAVTWQNPAAGVTKSAGPDAGTQNTYQVSIMGPASGADPAGTGIKRVCPIGGFTYSAMIGDSTNINFGMGFLEQTFQVTAANADFFYNYAIVLNNPGHCYFQQPYFNVAMLDQNGDTIPHCGNYNVVAGGANVTGTWKFLNKGTANEIDYLDWTTAFVSLKAYIGQCVTVVVVTSDCGQGGHYGYAYFAAQCKQLGIITSAPALCGNPIQLTAPSGGLSYQWTAPPGGCMTPAAGNTQTITVSCVGKYQVIIQTVAGAACADTLDTVIVSSTGTAPKPNFTSDTVCAGNPTQLTNLTTGGGPANTYSWSFQGGGTSTATNPTYTFPSAGTYTVQLDALNGGCGGDTTLSVVVTGPPTAGFTAPTVCQNSPTVFTNTSTGGAVVFKWIFGDGTTSNVKNPPGHTYTTCGTFNVILVAGTPPCVDSAKQTVTVNPNPTPVFTANVVCLGSNTAFTDATTVGCGGTEASWSWNFGDPTTAPNNTSAVQDPTHIFSGIGTYQVSFEITTAGGCKDSITTPVNVVGAPVAKFTSTPVCLGKPVVFTNQTVPAPTTSTWNFGDGVGTSNATSPSYTYTTAGTYTVKLVVSSGAGCTDSITSTVTVAAPPTAGFTATTVCQGTATAFTDTSHVPTAWKWYFGDAPTNGTSTLQNPTYIYGAAGTYQVKEVTTNAGGCKDSITIAVTVNPNPTATVTVPPVCLGTPSVFTLVPTNMAGGTYSWLFGDAVGTSTAQSPSYTYTANGSYTATVNLTSVNTCTGKATVVAIVNPIPVANFVAPAVCQDEAAVFTDKSTIANVPAPQSIKTWAWVFGDGGTSALQNPTHQYAKCGTYNVMLTVTSTAGCTHDTTLPITINPVPAPSFTATSVCKLFVTTFTDKSTIGCGDNITTWSWNFGDGNTSAVQNPTHTYGAAGVFNVTLKVTSSNGCDSSITLPVTVYPIPVPSFTENSPCLGSPTNFTDKSTVVGGTITAADDTWRFGDGGTAVGTATPSHTYAAPGTYQVTLTVTSNFGCIDSITIPVVVYPNPVPGFFSDTAGCVTYCVSFTDTSNVVNIPAPESINSYAWNFGDGSIDSTSSLAAPSHCFSTVGTFSIGLTVTTNHGCSATLVRPNYITTWPVPVAKFSASPNPTDTLNPTVVYTDNSTGNPVWWQWTFGDITDSTEFTPNGVHTFLYTGTFQDTGTYWANLVIKNKYGCRDSISEPVVITPFWTFYIPNAFTPNGDGLNDGFIPKAVGLREFEMWIFDRWGQQLYHCTSLTQPWDGTVHNAISSTTQCQEDTYVWLVQFTDIFHNSHRYVGRVTLIR